MSGLVTLRGMTWNHPRGYAPMVATAAHFAQLRPDVQITWDRRSLQEFADQPIDQLAERYDLLVIDHPWAGFAAASGVLLPLDELIEPEYLADQARHSVGKSHESYHFAGHQWALAIDAATPVAAYRPDLLQRAGATLPQTWDDVIALGRRGLVCCPGIPLDCYCNFVNLCASTGADLFIGPHRMADRAIGLHALELMRQLSGVVPRKFFELNPIGTLDVMSSTDDFAYCPYTYGYSNYSRPGFAPHLVRFCDVVQVVPGRHGSTMLGGTGLAISARCTNVHVAVQYAKFVASGQTQRGIYFESGGQPGHRSAWLDIAVNQASSDFFASTLATLDRAFLRPRFTGYLGFQDRAGDPIHAWLRDGGNANRVLDQLDELYRTHGQGAS